MATEIKDKRIRIYTVETDRSASGYERKQSKAVTKTERVWAYARQLSEKERFAAKAAGTDQSMLFKIGYNASVSSGQYVDFKGKTYRIESVDRFEFNRQDLVLRAVECEPEVADDKQ